MLDWIALGVLVIALGFIGIILVVNTHLSRLRRDLLELRAYLISALSNH